MKDTENDPITYDFVMEEIEREMELEGQQEAKKEKENLWKLQLEQEKQAMDDLNKDIETEEQAAKEEV